MSDSESDLLPSNVYTFQNESTAFCAKGPNVNGTNLTGLSFRNNVLTSTMQMPRNFERQRYRELSFDQRSMSYRRETSPMSMYSDMRPKNFHHSFYPGGMSSQRSMYNGKSGSSMSMRSMDSNASVSAVDIAMAFKNANFNKYDLKLIKEAYNKLMKRKVRKRVEKRRNMRLFLKGYRRKSGYDSGEQGSDSSISSDDCRSTHSAMYKDNMSSCRSTRTDITDFRRSIKESNMYKDCTNHFKSNAFKNMFSASHNTTGNNDRLNSHTVTQNQPTLNQKERFKNGFLLPSQRFNKSVASVPIPEKERAQTRPTFNPTNTSKCAPQKTNDIHETGSDQEEIFFEVTVRENSKHNTDTENNIAEGKRSLEIEERQCSDRKRTKLSSPKKQNKTNDKMVLNNKSRNVLREDNINNNNKKTGDFEFVKPQLPLRKSAPGKFKDKLISKSAPPLLDVIVPPPKAAPEEHVQNTVQNDPQTVLTKDDKINTDKTTEEHADTIHHSNSDMSMRPSFIKRKLFTQKMDVTESKNLSLERINVNSPETNVYSAIQKEKHKARKLVTNQSCLNRDVIQENNNLLDLIHKIVPADQMNITNVTNKTSLSSRQSKDNKHVDDEKWDVTSIISTCNTVDVSDTYTDEEIFHDNNKPNKNTLQEKPVPKPQPVKDCSIVIEKIPEIKMVVKNKFADYKLPTPKKAIDNKTKSVQNCVKSFWDTDFESDLESPAPKRWADLREKTINTINSIPERDISFSNQNNKSMQVSKKISNTHNTTSLSECLKSNVNSSVLDYTMGKLKKYNINRNLTIKAFGTPKIKITKNNKKEKKADTITMFPNKNELAKNRKHQTMDVKEKQTEVKQNKTEIRNTKVAANKVVESAKKTKNTNTKAETIKKKPEIKKAIENVTSTKELAFQNKIKSNSVKPQIPDVQKVNSAKTRVLRTPKKKVCYNNSLEIENMKENVNPKCYTSKSTKTDKKVRSSGNDKKAEHPTEPMNRTLRTRKIDLSSSLNTTNENGANITIKSLRSRRINLSSSINNSTPEGKLSKVKKKLQRSPVKNSISKIRNEVKRPRMVKNNSVKG